MSCSTPRSSFSVTVIASLLALTAPVVIAAAQNGLLQYQARLLDPDTGHPLDGEFTMMFALYDIDEGGTPLWTETKSVEAVNGLVHTLLGDVTVLELTIFDGQPLWLGITVDADEEATPRQRITSAGYALHAFDAGTLAGMAATEFAEAGHTHDAGEISMGVLDDAVLPADLSREGHTHDADAITTGVLDDARIPASIARTEDVWRLGGNAVLNDSAFGTVNSYALDFLVNNNRALRLEPHTTAPNLIGGHPGNTAEPGVYGAAISGGGTSADQNWVSANYGAIGGGRGNSVTGLNANVGGGSQNVAGGDRSAVGGGMSNQATGEQATISGGTENVAGGVRSAIGGGRENEADGPGATIGGGFENMAGASYATVPGGRANHASGTFSFAAGHFARATHARSFVWSGRTQPPPVTPMHSFADGSFSIIAPGGIWLGRTTEASEPLPTGVFLLTSTGANLTNTGVWTNASDRNKKENFSPVNTREILDKVAALPITTWNYKVDEDTVQHLGPMAQDFYEAFGLGQDDTTLNSINTNGVALAAIQGLNDLSGEQSDRIASLEAENDRLREQLEALEARLDMFEQARTAP